MLGSNQRRLSRRFYSTILLFESYATDLRLCVTRRPLRADAVRHMSVRSRPPGGAAHGRARTASVGAVY